MSRWRYVITFVYVCARARVNGHICMTVGQRDNVELHNVQLERLIATQCYRLAVSLFLRPAFSLTRSLRILIK